MKKYCLNNECHLKRGSREIAHEILGVEKPFGTADHYRIKCPECGEESFEVVPKVSRKKRTWPYFHAGVGRTFESESHEQKFTKAHGLTKE